MSHNTQHTRYTLYARTTTTQLCDLDLHRLEKEVRIYIYMCVLDQNPLTIRRGERGAGYLYKQGKARGNWTKRYFVLTDYSLRYYADYS
jgi:hypothetical protein